MPHTATRPEIEAEGLLATRWRHTPAGLEVPIDPIVIARDLGLEVFEVHLGDPDLSGMLSKGRGQEARIYLNEANHEHRQRFTCAHEVGHYVKRTIDGGDNDVFEYVDRRNHLSSRGTDPEERWANAFAAALLMPAQYVIAHYPFLGHTGLANQLRVSLEAIGNRINNLQMQGRL